MRRSTGFTLIELLMVIAIIGLLSSLILFAVNESRSRSLTAAAKNQLVHIRDQAIIYFDKHGESYTTNTEGSHSLVQCTGLGPTVGNVFTDPVVQNQIVFLNSISLPNSVGCVARSNGFAIVGQLKNQHIFCMDDSLGIYFGISGQQSGDSTIAYTSISGSAQSALPNGNTPICNK